MIKKISLKGKLAKNRKASMPMGGMKAMAPSMATPMPKMAAMPMMKPSAASPMSPSPAPMGLKKGGKVKKATGGMAKKPGLAIVIAIGKPKGRGK